MPSKKESMKVKSQDTAIFFIIATAVFFTPLIYFKNVNELFEFPKMMFSYFAFSTAGMVFVVKRLLHPKDTNLKIEEELKPITAKKSLLEKAVYLLLLANFISAVFSILPYTSVFGYYTRFNGGLASIVLWTLLFTVLIKIKYENLFLKLGNVLIFSTIPVSVYAVLQRLGIEKNVWIEDSQTRVFSSLGQPNWLAAFLVMLIPLVLFRAMEESNQKKKVLLSALAILNFSALWFTYSFSGFLGILGAVLLFFIFINKESILKNKIQLISITGITFLVMVTNPGVFGPKLKDSINDVQNKLFPKKTYETYVAVTENAGEAQKLTPAKEPQSNNTGNSEVSESKDEDSEANPSTNPKIEKPKFGDTTGIRLTVWRGSLNLATSSIKNLLIGSGPETFPYAFLKFRPKEMNLTTEWDFVFNKPHNYYIEILCNLGLVGLFTYLFLIKGIFVNFKNQRSLPLKAGILGLFITDAFGWHTVMTSMLLYIFLALIQKEDYEN